MRVELEGGRPLLGELPDAVDKLQKDGRELLVARCSVHAAAFDWGDCAAAQPGVVAEQEETPALAALADAA